SPAQTYYYDETKTFHEDGFTYQCDNDEGNIRLYNSQNRFVYTEKTYRDGSKLPEDIARGRIHAIEEENWTRPKARSIANDTFSAGEKAIVKGWRYGIQMMIDTDTGKVTEVVFFFSARSPYARILPSTYREIERRLKTEIWFTITDVGKQLNFASLTWGHEVK
ncbi:MAG: DUF5043 domain-containing protein, partial [Odoribacteraceae bacterium]|nr:DUF5043 domain-containing protein [Odoribacteraceae bacterium]